jgi:Flp pilus assembly pilin Flp
MQLSAATAVPRFLRRLLTLLKRENTMNILFKRLWKDEEGQDLVEYALLVVLISLGCVVAMKNLASGISDAFANAVTNLTT